MNEQAKDRWAEWSLRRRDAGDPERRQQAMEFLGPVRDRVLENAALSDGETLLDVGAGDGLIAFGALDRVGEEGCVIFSDVSQDLLDHSRTLAEEMGVLDRCRFVRAPADDLSAIPDSSVDAVTTRSVLIYVDDKRRVFEEFYRVLKPGGRLSIFEPINSFGYPEPPHLLWGYDVTPIQDLARRVRDAQYRNRPDPSDNPMLNFDERDLFGLAEDAGFEEVHLSYEARTNTGNPAGVETREWNALIRSAPNPLAPTFEEAMDEALTPKEAERLTQHLRPLVEGARRENREAAAYLRAVKADE